MHPATREKTGSSAMTISPINLGSFFTNSSGSTVSSGLASGLNTKDVIAGLTAAQSAQITTLNDQVTVNNKQVSALSDLTQVLSSLQSAVTAISNPQSVDTTNNLFAVRASQITSNTTQPASNYINATVASGTPSGTYTITDISQLATPTIQETNAFTVASASVSVVAATPTAGMFNPGEIDFADGKKVTIHTDDTLNIIEQNFNSISASTGVSASILQTAPGQFKLVFTSTTTGDASNFDLSSSGTTITYPSPALANLTFHSDGTGQNAKFKLNNVDIERTTNNINDLISGVTINLTQDTTTAPGASFTLQVTPDTSSITQGINAFATAYNNFLYYYSKQTQLGSDGTPTSASTLFSDTTLRSIYDSVTGVAASLVKGLATGQPATLDALGISFTDFAGDSTTPATSNVLSVDASTLQSVLSTNFTGVENVFGSIFTASSSNLIQFQGPTQPTVSNFTVDVNQSADPPTYTATYTDSNSVQQVVNLTPKSLTTGGVSLTGPDGSVFAGMVLIYGSSGDESGITVTATQGIGAAIQSVLTGALQASSGLIATDQSAIQTKNTGLQTQITNTTNQLDTTRQALLQKYSALEAAINSANSTLDLLNAQQLVNSAH